MTRDEFLQAVVRRADVSEERAEVLTSATLSTLADRLSRGEADDIAAQLPSELQDAMIPDAPEAEPFDLDEFLRRVSERAGVPLEEAADGVRAVMTTLRDAITAGEFEDMLAQLPRDFSESGVVPGGRG